MRSNCMAAIRFMALAGLMILVTGRPALADSGPQKLCPVLGGEIDRSVYADYEGKRIYFCCAGCIDTFQRSPAKYVRDLEVSGILFEKVSAIKASSPAEAGKGKARSPVVDDAHLGQDDYQGQLDAPPGQDVPQGEGDYQGQHEHQGNRATEQEGTHRGMHGTGCPMM